MIKLEFTEAEFNALAGLIDAGVRATGLRAVKEAAVILQKLEQAAGQAAPQAPSDSPSEG
jgi:hypothetical protein